LRHAHLRGEFGHFGEISRIVVSQLLFADDGNRDRDVLQRFFALAGGDDDFFQRASGLSVTGCGGVLRLCDRV
jgi:hypothetical protein